MRAVVQRVSYSNVKVNDEIKGKIDKGIMLLLGVAAEDEEKDLEYIFEKVINLRIFEDENNKMNKSLLDIGGSILVISQFTINGDARKGRRPSFINAAKPVKAKILYEKFIEKCEKRNIKTQKGIFGAHMHVELCNDGPVTILLDSTKLF